MRERARVCRPDRSSEMPQFPLGGGIANEASREWQRLRAKFTADATFTPQKRLIFSRRLLGIARPR